MNGKHIWDFLLKAIGNPFGAAGLMGNLYAESALNPRNLQQTYERKLGMTDDGYTEAVDSGRYANFVRDGAGYGLAQWTYPTRKELLLDYANTCGTSIGDLDMQLCFLMLELRANYGGVLSALKSAKTVREASDAVLLQYERPKDRGEAARARRADYGQRYYDVFRKPSPLGKVAQPQAVTDEVLSSDDIKEGDTMAVKIGSARIDENGNATGGRAGDQTGKEVSTQNWYRHSKGWRVFRAKSATAAERIAACMQAACDNAKIGYDQNQRNTLYTAAKAVGFDCARVTAACETDCSALVRVCCAFAGIMLPDIRTTNEPKALLDSGAFTELTGSKYADSSDCLRRGDILCTRTQGHTVVVLSNGPKAEPAVDGLSRGDYGTAVKAMQANLLAWNPDCLPGYGADGDFGGETEKALKAFQEAAGLPVTGVYDDATRAKLTGLEPVPEPTPEPTPGPQYVQINEIHVRSAPGDKYQSLGTVQPGYRMPYQGETHKGDDGVPWHLVEFDGQNGWISGNLAEVI